MYSKVTPVDIRSMQRAKKSREEAKQMLIQAKLQRQRQSQIKERVAELVKKMERDSLYAVDA